jgi:hypothetical protein
MLSCKNEKIKIKIKKKIKISKETNELLRGKKRENVYIGRRKIIIGKLAGFNPLVSSLSIRQLQYNPDVRPSQQGRPCNPITLNIFS